MGINPIVFGPYTWATIHLICLGAPRELTPEQQKQYKTFLNLLADVLPCRNCGKHLAENLKKLPIDNSLGSSSKLFEWSVNLHNLVNSQLGKERLSPIDALKFWSSAPQCSIHMSTGKSSFGGFSNFMILFALIVGILIGYVFKELYVRKYKK